MQLLNSYKLNAKYGGQWTDERDFRPMLILILSIEMNGGSRFMPKNI